MEGSQNEEAQEDDVIGGDSEIDDAEDDNKGTEWEKKEFVAKEYDSPFVADTIKEVDNLSVRNSR